MFRVVSVGDFEEQFAEIQKRAKEGDNESVYLVKIIENGIEKLKFNYKYGDHISGEKIPKEYIEKYGVKNLWKLNLSSFWRLIYTIKGNEIEVISVLLEVLDHKDYDRKFGYKTK